MVFTLSSLLKDLLTSFVSEKRELKKKEEEERVRKQIEVNKKSIFFLLILLNFITLRFIDMISFY